MSSPDWNLKNFGIDGVAFCCFFTAFIVFNFFFWNTFLLKPIKLIAVFCYELNHVITCRLTGGKSKTIELYNAEKEIEKGLTELDGGVKCFYIPAGYMGNAFWGMVFVALSGNRISSTIVTCLFVVALVSSLKFTPKKLMTVLFIVSTIIAIFIDWFVFHPLLVFVTLYYGVSIGTFAVYADLRRNQLEPGAKCRYIPRCRFVLDGADAKACHGAVPCCLTRCVGLQFIVYSLVCQIIGIYLALVLLSDNQ